MGRSELVWHFIDYPKKVDKDETFLLKMTDGDLVIASWDEDRKVWLDAGRDWDWFGAGVACWAEMRGIPDATKQMPTYKEHERLMRRPYPKTIEN